MRSVLIVFVLFLCIPSTLFLHSEANHLLPINPWQAFMRLSGCRLGDNCFGLSFLKRYLRHFGYLHHSIDLSDDFDAVLQTAILAYQNNFNLNATGFLDISTLEIMISPRCGVADLVNGTGGGGEGRNLYSYFPNNPVWPVDRRSLTYAFESVSDVTVSEFVIRKVISRAFGRWAAVSSMSFTEVNSTQFADIKIGFYRGEHGDGEAFDGILGTLAHAFSPTNGRFHLDASELWAAAPEDVAASELFSSTIAIDLESVAVHEIGHLLGLGHSTVRDSIMYPSLRPGTRRVELTGDDVEGIQSLYGSSNGSGRNYYGNHHLEDNDGGGGGYDVVFGVWFAMLGFLYMFL